MKEIKEYQKKAIEELEKYFGFYVKLDGKQIVFKSPPGSGKTFVMTKFLEDVCGDVQYEDENIAFIWISIGKAELQKQSFNKVRDELRGNPECSLLSPSFLQSHSFIDNRQIVFANWEELYQTTGSNGQWKNNMMRDQEGLNFIQLLDNTKNNGTKLILIVDESHIGSKSDKTNIYKFKNEIIAPNLTIEMSATPHMKENERADVEIKENDVIAEGMIKEELVVNKNIKANGDYDGDSGDTITLVMESAESQRKKIVENFKQVGAHVNPLVLVQVPNSELGDATMEIVERYLEEIGITEDNGLLAKWFTGSKSFDTKKLVRNDNEIEYLIFKTAVDTGWDCPRAHILVKFREVDSNTAQIQTIGRILRTPEAKKYNNPVLDKGYVFTNMEYIDPRSYDDYDKNRVKDIEVRLKQGKDASVEVKSYFQSRRQSYNSADTRIYSIIEDEFCKKFNIKENDIFTDDYLESQGLNVNNLHLSQIVSETNVSIDSLNREERIGGGIIDASVKSSSVEIRSKVENLIARNLNGLALKRSISPIKQGIQKTLQKHLSGLTMSKSMEYTLLLIARNEEIFADLISKSTARFKNQFPDVKLSGQYENFRFNETMRYSSSTFKEIECMLSLYDKMYVDSEGTSDLENRFAAKLDKDYTDRIDWVWHNGQEHTEENFGIEVESNESVFRPDFLIKFKDGRFGIFDTKPSNGHDFEDTKRKAEALFKYINENRDLGINVFGGIIVQNKYGDFLLNQNPIYETYEMNPNAYSNIDYIF